MTLRPMTKEDYDKMLEWKNYEETRQYAIASKEPIKKEDHYDYLDKNLKYFQIIESVFTNLSESMDKRHKIVKCGAVRVKDDEVAIWIDRAFRGLGIASEAIRRVSQEGMVAKIVEGNISSMRAFINAGFKPMEYLDGYYIFGK